MNYYLEKINKIYSLIRVNVKKYILIVILIFLTIMLIAGCNNLPNVVITRNPTGEIKTDSIVTFSAKIDNSSVVTKSINTKKFSYKWIVSNGTILSESGKSMKWKAPKQPGNVTISLQAWLVDSPEETFKTSINISVTAAPAIKSYSEFKSLRFMKEANFKVNVRDKDTALSELTYTWSVNGKEMDSINGSSFNYTPGKIGTLKVEVVVSDGIYHTKHQWNLKVIDPDLDEDGLTNAIENRIGTKLNIKDTDNDGLSDYEEVKLGINPLESDTDNDDITDKKEIDDGTNPKKADTDNDSVIDPKDIAPTGDAFLKIILKSLKLSPKHLAENPSRIYINGYFDDQEVINIPTFKLHADQLHKINKEFNIDIPENQPKHDIIIEVKEEDIFFDDLIDINPDLNEKKSFLNNLTFNDEFSKFIKANGTVDKIKEEDGILKYRVVMYTNNPITNFMEKEGISNHYGFEDKSLIVYGMINKKDLSSVIITVSSLSSGAFEKEIEGLVSSGVYVGHIDCNLNQPQLINYNIKGLDEKGNTLKSYYKKIPYPDMETYKRFRKRQERLANLIKETETALENYEVDNAEKKIKKIESLSPNNKQISGLKEKLEEKQKIILQIGEKPENSSWDFSVWPVKKYLNIHLKDPDSVEYIEWFPVHLLYIEGTPSFWRVRVQFRAKNSFGGYVIEDKYFYIKYGQVVRVKDV